MEDRATQLSQRVERDVRQTLGELTMQTIVLRAMMEMGVQPDQQPDRKPPPPPPPPKRPEPIPPQPEQPPEQAARFNGGAH
jgi:hypothetical protein